MERFGSDLGREEVNFAKGTWRAMDFNRFPKEREGEDEEDEDKGNACCGGVGFGGFANISAIVELKETFFFSCYVFFTKKMHRKSDSNF